MATYTGPNGWTADSVVGAINAASQAPITAEDLLTSKGQARDSALESRSWMNPYTGVRDPALVGSVYAQPNTPAWLAGEVSALNAEQALRRSAQAEIFNRIFEQATGGGGLPWLEVLRAAVLQPGVEAGFGSSVVDPNFGKAALNEAAAKQTAADAYANTLNDPLELRRQALRAANQTQPLFNTGWSAFPQVNKSQNYNNALTGAERVASAVIGTNPFAAAQGYITNGGGTTAPGTGRFSPYASNEVVRPPATNQAYGWGGGYVGPTQFSLANPAYNTYAGSNFLK